MTALLWSDCLVIPGGILCLVSLASNLFLWRAESEKFDVADSPSPEGMLR